MSAPVKREGTREEYERDAREYYLAQRMEDVMEASPQAMQREITLASFNGLKGRSGKIGYFNEMLLQKKKGKKFAKLVPDNMVVLGDPGTHKRKSYMVEHEDCAVFWVLEYVSDDDPEKDYVKNFEKLESIFKVPYYLIFDPEQQALTFYRLREGVYRPVDPGENGRFPVEPLDVEVALLNGWLRFWFKGELLPLTDELESQMKALRKEMDQLRADNANLQSRHTTLQSAHTALLGLLRSLVEAKARVAGRQDILDALSAAPTPGQLEAWLRELG